jgi:hypothetical protein
MKLYEINNKIIAEEYLLLEKEMLNDVEDAFAKLRKLIQIVKEDSTKLKLGVVEMLLKKAENYAKQVYNEYIHSISIRDTLINTDKIKENLIKIKNKIDERLNEILQVRFNKDLIWKLAEIIQNAISKIEQIVKFIEEKNKYIIQGISKEVSKELT